LDSDPKESYLQNVSNAQSALKSKSELGGIST